MLAAVSGARVGHDHTDLSLGDSKGFAQFGPHTKRTLRAGPDRELPVLPLGYGGARLQRGVGDVSNRVRPFELQMRRRHPFRHRAERVTGTPIEALLLNHLLLEEFE